MNTLSVTVIVPAYNTQKTIRKCVESLIGINYSKYDILIVNDGSIDKTQEILFEYKDKIKVINSRHFGPSKCRNIAIKEAKGDFIAFTDSDCVVDKNWIKELIRGFDSNKVVGVGGTQQSPGDETAFGKRVQQFFELTGFLGGYIKKKQGTGDRGQGIVRVEHNPSCNVMYRRSALLEIGGFNETLWPGEDVDLDYRLKKKGYEFRYNPDAIIYHYRPQSIQSLAKMMYRYGLSMGILTKKYGFFRRIQFLPLLVILFFVLVILNQYFLLLIPILIGWIIFKVENFLDFFSIFNLLLVSFLNWMAGFLKGIILQR